MQETVPGMFQYHQFKTLMDYINIIDFVKVGPTQLCLLTQRSLFWNYIPRPHHEGAACINLRSRTRNLLIPRQARYPLCHGIYYPGNNTTTIWKFVMGTWHINILTGLIIYTLDELNCTFNFTTYISGTTIYI